jgi:hypothetical protein
MASPSILAAIVEPGFACPMGIRGFHNTRHYPKVYNIKQENAPFY